jgi:signal transduction histidine kinase
VQVEIRVQDQGQGLSPEKLAHVFERFYRSETASSNPGFGLGLPIAKSLLEGQGGTITMESESGKGSVVILSFRKVS